MDIKNIIIFLLLIIIVIGGFFLYKQIKSNKKQESFTTTVLTLGFSLITMSSSDWMDKGLVAIGVITKYDDAMKLGGDFNWAYFIVGFILIIVGLFMWLYSKKRLYILNINAYSSKKLEDYISNLKLDNSDFREREIDFIQIYKKIFSRNLDDESYECIKAEIEEKVTAFRNETAKVKRGYTGIAPIPFIMYAGTFLNRIKIDEYYEFDKIDTNNYYLLNKSKNAYPELKLKTNINQLYINKNKVVIAISLTQQIEDNVLNQFVSSCNIVKIGVDNPDDNTIRYTDQLESYIDKIFDVIEQIKVKIPNVEISIVYSGQSCLALEIGKRCFDDTRIPETTVYHFDIQNTDKKYPWGIIINGSNKGKLIKA